MTNINVHSGQFCEVVDEYSFHLQTDNGIILVNVEQYTINEITFPTSSEAVYYIQNL